MNSNGYRRKQCGNNRPFHASSPSFNNEESLSRRPLKLQFFTLSRGSYDSWRMDFSRWGHLNLLMAVL
nr:MAG TPA: hypothetical protein [Caudoviricetes sp.]